MKKQDLNNTEESLSHKIAIGLQRVSEAFKALLWDKAKEYGLSPIQIQILIFIDSHKLAYNNVSYLAKEFNVTKPTISDAIKVLLKKDLIIKEHSSTDSRSYTILVSEKGKDIVLQTENYLTPVQKAVNSNRYQEQEYFFDLLSSLIYKLNQKEVLSVQRICYGCKYYTNQNNTHYCNLLDKKLLTSQIRIDCDEFESKQ